MPAKQAINALRAVRDLYVDGFRNMTVGRRLWLLIAIKLVLFFLVLKLFFFPDILSTRYDNDNDRAEAVRNNLALPSASE